MLTCNFPAVLCTELVYCFCFQRMFWHRSLRAHYPSFTVVCVIFLTAAVISFCPTRTVLWACPKMRGSGLLKSLNSMSLLTQRSLSAPAQFRAISWWECGKFGVKRNFTQCISTRAKMQQRFLFMMTHSCVFLSCSCWFFFFLCISKSTNKHAVSSHPVSLGRKTLSRVESNISSSPLTKIGCSNGHLDFSYSSLSLLFSDTVLFPGSWCHATPCLCKTPRMKRLSLQGTNYVWRLGAYASLCFIAKT